MHVNRNEVVEENLMKRVAGRLIPQHDETFSIPIALALTLDL